MTEVVQRFTYRKTGGRVKAATGASAQGQAPCRSATKALLVWILTLSLPSQFAVRAAADPPWHVEGLVGERRDILVINGMDYASYRVGEALAGYADGSVTYRDIVLDTGLVPKVTAYPDGAVTDGEMGKAAAILLVNVPAPALHVDTRQLMIRHMADGLRVLVFGGLFSLGKGQYDGTELMDIAPVNLLSRWSVMKVDPPARLAPAPGVALGADLNWEAAPCVLYRHQDRPKTGARVWLEAGGLPILVVLDEAKGRSAAFLSAPIGKPPRDVLAYWEWPDWPYLLRGIVRELLTDNGGTGIEPVAPLADDAE